jgi:DNA repair protein RecO (recombination protein O)
MTAYYKTKGFVFKKEDRLEADRIFTVFTRDFGRIEVAAKAIRRIASKLKGGIEVFSFSELEFVQGKHQKTLIDAVFFKKHHNICHIPEKMEVAHRISLVLDAFIRGQESDESIWNLVIDFFQKLDNCQLQLLRYTLLYDYFFWNFIAVLGHKPELTVCNLCTKKLEAKGLYFSQKEGGIICENCHAATKKGLKITPDVIKILRIILSGDWDTFVKLKLEDIVKKELQHILQQYHQYLLAGYSFGNS